METDIVNTLKLPLVIAVCSGLGWVIKSAEFKWMPNNRIPIILLLAGGILNYFLGGQTIEAACYGMGAGLASTGAHQVKHQRDKTKKVAKPTDAENLN